VIFQDFPGPGIFKNGNPGLFRRRGNFVVNRSLSRNCSGADSHEREKRLLLDEVVQLKKEKELLDRSLLNKDAEILDVHQQLEATSAAARTADNRIRLLDAQVRI